MCSGYVKYFFTVASFYSAHTATICFSKQPCYCFLSQCLKEVLHRENKEKAMCLWSKPRPWHKLIFWSPLSRPWDSYLISRQGNHKWTIERFETYGGEIKHTFTCNQLKKRCVFFLAGFSPQNTTRSSKQCKKRVMHRLSDKLAKHTASFPQLNTTQL